MAIKKQVIKKKATTTTTKSRTKKAKVELLATAPLVKAVGVRFNQEDTKYPSSGNVYDYMLDESQFGTVQQGDHVVILDPRNHLKVVEVVHVYFELRGSKYIVDVVDKSAYIARIERAKRKQQLAAELNKMKAQMDEDMVLNMYAQQNKEFAAILEAYRTL